MFQLGTIYLYGFYLNWLELPVQIKSIEMIKVSRLSYYKTNHKTSKYHLEAH